MAGTSGGIAGSNVVGPAGQVGQAYAPQQPQPTTGVGLLSQQVTLALGPHTTAHHTIQLADLTTGAVVAGVQTPVGSDLVRTQMGQSGMTNVSQPPTEPQLRDYYANHGPHHEAIQKHDYAGAAAGFDQDYQTLEMGDPKRGQAVTQSRQLNYAAKMQEAAQKLHPPQNVSFPPTLDEVKTYFKGMKNDPPASVARAFQDYATAFYSHVQGENPGATVNYDATTKSGCPKNFSEITDQRALNKDGNRLIDCKGYAWLGNELLGSAGFSQPPGGAYHVVEDQNGQHGHIMLGMQRPNGQNVWVSNWNAWGAGPGDNSARQKCLANGCHALSGAEHYQGTSEDMAAVLATDRHASDRRSLS